MPEPEPDLLTSCHRDPPQAFLNALARPLLSGPSMRSIRWVLLFATAFLIARIIGSILEGALTPDVALPPLRAAVDPPYADPYVPISAFLHRNLFARAARGESTLAPAACTPASLRARLVATVIGEEGAVAWFDEGEAELRRIGVGDRIDGSEVIGVDRGAVRFARDGSCTEVLLASLGDTPANTAGKTRVLESLSRADIEAALADPMRFARDMRIVPSLGAHGFKLYAIRPGGIAAMLGFENGDLLQRINGQALVEPNFHTSEILASSELTIDYVRKGRPQTRTLRIE